MKLLPALPLLLSLLLSGCSSISTPCVQQCQLDYVGCTGATDHGFSACLAQPGAGVASCLDAKTAARINCSASKAACQNRCVVR